ncbi:hypothetical protein CVT26_015404 [Gymnopilus dilepis]|uniref:Secreted protein n=1 Tax=Gymnopilus dilepis TaxID=231916 RepID=A0A409YE90_9AGAR|nr:hypothetical protein CVT26_015404 [Gymnopilus dilepis]
MSQSRIAATLLFRMLLGRAQPSEISLLHHTGTSPCVPNAFDAIIRSRHILVPSQLKEGGRQRAASDGFDAPKSTHSVGTVLRLK